MDEALEDAALFAVLVRVGEEEVDIVGEVFPAPVTIKRSAGIFRRLGARG